MYGVQWDNDTGGIILSESSENVISGEVRPVFHEELDLLGFQTQWAYERTKAPLLWALGRRYYFQGRLVAEAKGGAFFEKPRVEFYEQGLRLGPVKMPAMLEKNSRLIEGLAHRAIEFIDAVYRQRRRKVDAVAVAFSGGKDSLVTLDLVQRSLPPDEFVVVFDDTTMEISATYDAVEKAKQRWSNLTFLTARSPKPAEVTWEEMGPPSRLLRWCCTVHKSAPTLLLLREHIGKPSVRALVYDGVRNEESQRRAGYVPITVGGKHATQINASPILRWNVAEIFAYLFARDLLYNEAYRLGLSRVGCSVCPFNSNWGEAILWQAFEKDVHGLIQVLREYAKGETAGGIEAAEYVRAGRWKSRGGGRGLAGGGNRVVENETSHGVDFYLRHPNEDWLEWAKSLGTIVREGKDKGYVDRDGARFPFELTRHPDAVEVKVTGVDKSDRLLRSYFRAVAHKTAYCVHCQGCEVECPTGALTVNGTAKLDAAKCIRCSQCLTLTDKGCWASKSLSITAGGSSMKGFSRYQTFGITTGWLEEFFQDPDRWWHTNQLGNRQFEATRAWLTEMEIVEGSAITRFGDRLRALGARNSLTWALAWTNLARNSALIQWYVSMVPWEKSYAKNELIDMLDHSASLRTRENGITALIYLLKSTPLGTELGFGEVTTSGNRTSYIAKRGWHNAHPVAILYSLYRYAEKVGRYDLSMTELLRDPTEGPYSLFGLMQQDLIASLRGISSSWPNWLSVEFVRDLDNVYLDKTHSGLEVLELAR